MTDAEKLAEILREVAKLAANLTNRETHADYGPGDNGNYDDAYNDGYMDAEIHMARNILAIIQGV